MLQTSKNFCKTKPSGSRGKKGGRRFQSGSRIAVRPDEVNYD